MKFSDKSSDKLKVLTISEITTLLDDLLDDWTAKKASPPLLKIIIRDTALKIGMYPLLLKVKWFLASRYRHFLESCYRQKQVGSCANNDRNSENTISCEFLQSFVRVRSLSDALEPEVCEKVWELGKECHNVVCLGLTSRNLQILYLLRQNGASNFHLFDKRTDDVDTVKLISEFSSFILRSKRGASGNIDIIVVDAHLDLFMLNLLTPTLFGGCLLIASNSSPDSPFTQVFPMATECFGNTAWHRLPMPSLIMEKSCSQSWDLSYWPLRPMPFKFPAEMPSGRPWPKISIVTATLNQSYFLEETLRSVMLQEYPNLEFIVIDGGSTDGSAQILERYRGEMSTCIIEPDRGQAHALNKGFSLATGEILAWLNSDDYYLPGTLWRVALAFDLYPTADILAGGCVLQKGISHIPEGVHHSRLSHNVCMPLPLNRLLDLDGGWLKGDFFYQPEVFWRNEIWKKSGAALDDSLHFSMDYDLWVRFAIQGAVIVAVDDAFAVFRVHEEQKTWGRDLPYLPELRRVNANYRSACFR